MKKIVTLLLLISSVFVLTACGEIEVGTYPELKDSKTVEMSAEEVATIISEVENIDNLQSVFGITLNGQLDYAYNESNEYYTQSMALEGSFDIKGYMNMSDQIEDAAYILNVNADIDYSSSFGYSSLTSVDVAYNFNGTMNAYLFEQYAYLDYDIAMTTNNLETTITDKQKLNTPITMEDLEDLFDISSLSDIPVETTSYDVSELQAYLEAYPAFTVYIMSGVTYIEFEVTKDLIKDHVGDIYAVIYEEENGIAPTTSEINEFVDEFSIELDEAMTNLNVSLVFAIKDNELVQFALEVSVTLNDDNASYANFLFVMDKLDEMPAFPEDLDTYTGVDDFSSLLDFFN